jgi:transposase-like protein
MRKRLTQEIRKQLVELYLKNGMKGVAEMAEVYGLQPKTVANMASKMGMRRQVQPGRATQTENDKRWRWAVERGPVVV